MSRPYSQTNAIILIIADIQPEAEGGAALNTGADGVDLKPDVAGKLKLSIDPEGE